jgi:hypothetical protein
MTGPRTARLELEFSGVFREEGFIVFLQLLLSKRRDSHTRRILNLRPGIAAKVGNF